MEYVAKKSGGVGNIVYTRRLFVVALARSPQGTTTMSDVSESLFVGVQLNEFLAAFPPK